MRRKLPPFPLVPAVTARLPNRAADAPLAGYRVALAKARALGLFTAMAIAPLGAIAGSVAACGGAAPVQAYPRGDESAPPLATIAPPSASSNAPAAASNQPVVEPAP